MRKDSVEFSDKSSSSVLFKDRQSSLKEGQFNLLAQKSNLEINMEQLLGELSEIKAENGLSLLEEVNQEEMNHKPKRSSDPTFIHQQRGEIVPDNKLEEKKEEEEEISVVVTTSKHHVPETEE